MKKLVFIFFLSFFVQITNAQKQGNIWYFGDHAGLDFNSGVPIPLLNGQPPGNGHSYIEGTSVISDSSGALLFYSSGEEVWNKNHQLMPNGDSLMGNYSSTQSCVIVPKPASENLFYLFTTDAFINNLKNGFRYSVIDICLHNGLGDVLNNQKNILLLDTVAEKLTAARHTNGIDYWVVTHKYFSDAFYSYLLTAIGITDTVISHIGSIHHGNCTFPENPTAAAIGQMKISPDGKKIAVVNENTCNNIREIFDFNATTGIVSNWIDLRLQIDTFGSYGVSFSPDNSKLYLSDNSFSTICQYDLSAAGGQADSIRNSKVIICNLPYLLPGEQPLALQLGPDGKIYVARLDRTFLAAINNPNVKGTGCNYIDSAVSLNGRKCSLGLPNLIDSYSYSNTVVNCEVGINELSNKNIVVLDQNIPNPFAEQTTINYYLPDDFTRAQIIFLELSGKIIKTVDLKEKGKGQLNVFANDLTSGIYTYSLVVDGETKETKKMIKAK